MLPKTDVTVFADLENTSDSSRSSTVSYRSPPQYAIAAVPDIKRNIRDKRGMPNAATKRGKFRSILTGKRWVRGVIVVSGPKFKEGVLYPIDTKPRNRLPLLLKPT